jgi:hypothetical protein
MGVVRAIWRAVWIAGNRFHTGCTYFILLLTAVGDLRCALTCRTYHQASCAIPNFINWVGSNFEHLCMAVHPNRGAGADNPPGTSDRCLTAETITTLFCSWFFYNVGLLWQFSHFEWIWVLFVIHIFEAVFLFKTCVDWDSMWNYSPQEK